MSGERPTTTQGRRHAAQAHRRAKRRRRRWILTLWQQGQSGTAIARRVGVSFQRVYQVLAAAQVAPRPLLPFVRGTAQTVPTTQYVTGRPCKYGHLAPRQRANHKCLECHRLKNRQRAREKAGYLQPLSPLHPFREPAYRTIP